MKINKRLAAALTCYTLLIAAALWQLLPARTRNEQFILGAVLFFFAILIIKTIAASQNE
jgi:hypothetical protein